MIRNGTLDIGCLGSSPTTIGLMPPYSLDYEIISVQMEEWDTEALIVRPNIRSAADLKGKTIASPAGSTSHYQLLYLLVCMPACMHAHTHARTCPHVCVYGTTPKEVLNLTASVTVRTAQPSEHADLWRVGEIDGVCDPFLHSIFFLLLQSLPFCHFWSALSSGIRLVSSSQQPQSSI